MEAWERRGTERTWDVIDAVQRIAEARGVSMAEVALVLGDGPSGGDVDHPRRPDLDQLETNLRAADLHLSAAEIGALDDASEPRPPTTRTGPGDPAAQPHHRRPVAAGAFYRRFRRQVASNG